MRAEDAAENDGTERDLRSTHPFSPNGFIFLYKEKDGTSPPLVPPFFVYGAGNKTGRNAKKATGAEPEMRKPGLRIFLHGQSPGLLPAFTFPIGLIAEKKGAKIRTDIFLEVLRQKEEIPRPDTPPEGSCLCQQASWRIPDSGSATISLRARMPAVCASPI
ncbi:hypothetical protein [uncultured Gemmiger sp.]|uniref:hypothetical protein n=1 Tax=uncultured Gemmiger sp. TaxID=1623490 RepID=UPI0025CC5286|nr:hypothetical protein [uncultured Gemmiger sp.]